MRARLLRRCAPTVGRKVGIIAVCVLAGIGCWPQLALATTGDVFAAGSSYSYASYTSHFNYFRNGLDPRNTIDIHAKDGQGDLNHPLYAPEPGTVTQLVGGTTWGNHIVWTSEDGSEQLHMAHLNAVIKTGRVNGGDLIARIGGTGGWPAHLHIDRKFNGQVAPLVLSGRTLIDEPPYVYDANPITWDGPQVVSTGPIAGGGGDGSPPSTSIVLAPFEVDDPSAIAASWSSSDPESGIAEYQYSVGTAAAAPSWVSAGTSTQVTIAGLDLQPGTEYYVSVKARNGAGLWSGVGVSGGIGFTISDEPMGLGLNLAPPFGDGFTPVLAPTDLGTPLAAGSSVNQNFTTPQAGLVAIRYTAHLGTGARAWACVDGKELKQIQPEVEGADRSREKVSYVFLPAGTHSLNFRTSGGAAYIMAVTAGLVAPEVRPSVQSPPPVQTSAVLATTTRLSGPSSARARKSLKLAGTVSSAAAPGQVTITMSRKVGRKWKSAGHAHVTAVGGAYRYSFKPRYRGSWRFVASYSGGVSGSTTFLGSKSGTKSVRVK
jgi:hypothetical protein